MALLFREKHSREEAKPAKKSPPLFSFQGRVPQTSAPMGLQIKGCEFSLENEQIKTSSVLALSHILAPAPMGRFTYSSPPSEWDSPPPSLPTSPYLFLRKRLPSQG